MRPAKMCRHLLAYAVILMLLVACAPWRKPGRSTPPAPTVSTVPTPAAAPEVLPSATVDLVAPIAPRDDSQVLELVGYLGSSQARAVAVGGDYAYMGIGIQLVVVDVSDPARPRRMGDLVLPGLVLDVALAGDLAYVVTSDGAGLWIVDVSDPTRPVVVGNQYAGGYLNAIIVSGGYAFLSGGGLRILDISDPAEPILTSETMLGDGLPIPLGRVEAVVGDYAFVSFTDSAGGDGGFYILDVADPRAPAVLGSISLGGLLDELVVAGDHAYGLLGPGTGRLVVVDISDPARPFEVSLDPPTPRPGLSLAVVDNHLIVVDLDKSGPDPVGGLQVLDAVDAANPVPLGRVDGLAPEMLDVVISGERAYVATGEGLAIVDVSNLGRPAISGRYLHAALPGTARSVTIGEGYLYVAAGQAGLQIVDASDPASPRVAGGYDTAGHAWAVALSGRYAYVADEHNGLRVIDVSDPHLPVEVGFYDVPGPYEFFHGVALLDDHAFIADGGLETTGLRILDISDPTQPAELGFLALAGAGRVGTPPRVEDVAVVGGYVLLAAGTEGLRVIDISSPAAPVEVGHYETPGRSDNLAIAGRYVYLADGDLRIVDFSEPTAPAQVGFFDVPDLARTPYVAAQGRYVYLTGDGLRVLDASERASLAEVAVHPIPWGNVAVTGDMIYVAGDGLFLLHFGADG